LGIGGDLKGFLLLVTPKKTACMISALMNGKNPPSAVELKEEDISALKELGNIVVGSYLAAMQIFQKWI
jgi:chemotaxis protein CheY-P-specific phosphatase CheC